MTTVEATSEVFWTAFRVLPKKERNAVVEKMLRDKEFIEDLGEDILKKQDYLDLFCWWYDSEILSEERRTIKEETEEGENIIEQEE